MQSRLPHAAVELAALAKPFYAAPELDAEPVTPDELPALFRGLLAHEEHMTVRLARQHGAPVQLRVKDVKSTNDDYVRRIVLAVPGPASEKLVEFGIVHLRLNLVDDKVRQEIVAQSAPLGDILIRHNVFRRIEPRWYYRFGPGSCLRSELGLTANDPLYGRVGTIHCDGRPAIELLEVVVQ